MKSLFFLVTLCAFSPVFTQELLHCGSDEMESKLFQEHPEYKQAFLRSKQKLELFTKQFQQNPTKSGATYIIPVVFHIIHNNGPENINDSQIFDAMKQLNLQYRKLNPDTSQIVSDFQSIAADVQVEFRLAQIDPDGNCTSGITRTVSPLTYPGDHQVKSLIHWPREKYLNVYICADAAGLAGHALMPAVADTIPEWDGIVMRHDYVGTIGTSDYFKRTVLSHEIGHFLNLYHIWGGNNVPDFYYLPVGSSGNCSYDDEVTDTPNTIGWSSCDLSSSSCGSGLDNIQNYMDYAYCALMFTEGQKVRMHAALNSSVAQRNNLWSASNLIATGTNDLTFQLCQAKFESDKKIICVGDSIHFTDVSVHGITNRFWDFEGGIATNLTNLNPAVLYNQSGTFDVNLKVTNGLDTLEITLQDYIKVLPSSGTENGLIEGFEDPLAGFQSRWNILGENQSYNWEIAPVGFNSNQSIKINNFDAGTNRSYEFCSDLIDLSGYTSLAIAIDWAYAQRTGTEADLFRVYLSNDCGDTWIPRKLYSGMNALKSVNNLISSSFTPANSSEWASDTIIVNGASSFTDHTQVKFRFESKGGNNFFLDNIRIGKLNELGLSQLNNESQIFIYPNPSEKDGSVTIQWNKEIRPNGIQLVDMQGRIVFEQTAFTDLNSAQIQLEGLNSGYYLVQLKGENGSYSLPLVLN